MRWQKLKKKYEKKNNRINKRETAVSAFCAISVNIDV